MTLSEWLTKYPLAHDNRKANGAIYISMNRISRVYTSDAIWELYHLSDYAVTSSSCLGFWLSPTN